ncbi:MAG: ATP-binding cassette domain-containing protein [Chloroflexi bacterium]|nr:ATP-binding cassette domain-containing protein [Chloroflexota bacterium]
MASAIVLQNVTRRFGDHVAVNNLSFQVESGEVFGLLGPNGAGKTTTVNLITGLLRRHSGEVRVLGFDPQVEPRQVRQRIGLVPQETNLYTDLSAVDNLWHHAALYCADLSSAGKRIEEFLRLMRLWERRKDRVGTFSGGMKRRLALARALLHDPDVILFDEPTLGVDVQGRHVLWEHIKEQQAQGKIFIISTNDMMEADALCDRLVIVDHGQAMALDSPEHLKSDLGRDIVTLRTTPTIQAPESVFGGLGIETVTRVLPDRLRLEVSNAERIAGELVTRVAAAHRLESIRIARPTLDDVFLHHTGRALRE